MNEPLGVTVSDQSLSGLSSADEVRVMYSGVDHGALAMGDAILTAIGPKRLDLTGTQPVPPWEYRQAASGKAPAWLDPELEGETVVR